jgi:type I restriction enzyme, R subunit
MNSVEFLKPLLEIAEETLQAEKATPPDTDEDRGKAALTELFNEVKTETTPIMVERVVADIEPPRKSRRPVGLSQAATSVT